MRIMGLDYGTKTVGVAISDALKITAQGIETIQRKEENKLRKTCARIEQLIKEYEVEKIVLGFGEKDGSGSSYVGRASDDSGSRAYVNREQCKKGKPQAVR